MENSTNFVHIVLYIFVYSCLATKVLMGQYLPAERVVVSGMWGNIHTYLSTVADSLKHMHKRVISIVILLKY